MKALSKRLSWRWSVFRRERDLTVYAALLVVVFLLFAFLKLADSFPERSWMSLDQRILLALRDPGLAGGPLGPAWFQRLWVDLTVLGGVVFVTVVVLIVLGYLLVLGEWRTAIVFVAAVVAAGLSSEVLKIVFHRARPTIVQPAVVASGLSFPSGHSFLAAVVYPTLGALLARVVPTRRSRLYVIVVSLILAALVGASRVYLGVHYPSDVLAGWALGLSWSLLAWLILRRLQRRGIVEPAPAPTTEDTR